MSGCIDAEEYKDGEYALWYNRSTLVGVVSVLSGKGSVCARCATRPQGKIGYEVSDTLPTVEEAQKAFDGGNLRLTRDGDNVEIQSVKVKPWRSK